MKRRLIALIAVFAVPLLAACSGASSPPETADSRQGSRFTLLAGSELKDVEAGLKADIRKATGLDLAFTYSGTLDAVDRIAAGEPFDTLWVSHGKYLAMSEALKGRIVALERTASELRALRDANAVRGDRGALDYLLATTAAKLDWLTGFVESMDGSLTADEAAG